MNSIEQHFFDKMNSIVKCLGHVYRADNPKLAEDSIEFILCYLKHMNLIGFNDFEACSALAVLSVACAEVDNAPANT